MLEILIGYSLIFTGIIGSGIAGYFDLKTTEVPDVIPLIMCVIGFLLRGIYAFLSGNWIFLTMPSAVFLGFLGFGFLLYYTGQWGGADAKMLGSIGLLIAILPQKLIAFSFFPVWIDYFFNVFFVGAIYTIIYALIMTAINPKISLKFLEDLRKSKKEIFVFLSFSFCFIIIFSFLSGAGITSIYFGILLFGTYVLFKFLKVVENVGFKKRIKTKDLKEGDMIDEDVPKLGLKKKLIIGLTKEEVKSIKKIKKTICIKEGVRFVPVFCIALIVTLLCGNVLTILVQLIV
ncbi:MAG: prepilin peptidase [Candidatus Aenigmarchaeota archaeon]|nr:prepilin peptidase [Candidatus Aenigmarchaeota archaeon]